MIGELSPGLVLVIGALVIPLLPVVVRRAWIVALPVIGLMQLMSLPFGELGQVVLYGQQLTTLRIDKLSFVFGAIFLVAALLGVIYALHENDVVQQVAGLIYAGSAVGAVFAGDLVTLFLFWEGTAISSVVLIWARGTDDAVRSGMRYLVWQIGSGVILLAGILLHVHATRSIGFGQLGTGSGAGWSLGVWLIFLAVGIKAAFPLLHSWLPDAYPRATITGAVMLSAFTTKLAVYVLLRGFAGAEILVPIGVVMALWGVVYMVLEDDLRRVAAYVLMSQLGFMVVAAGLGSEMAINGAAAHAVTGILYKGLLFMALGAVLLRTGTASAAALGGLARTMPWTATFCAIGAASLAAVPLFAGFASKALILQAAMDAKHQVAWLALLIASAGGVVAGSLRITVAAFYGTDSTMRPQEAPANMLLAMGGAVVLTVVIGVWPSVLYGLLPYATTYKLLTFSHIVTQLQLVGAAAIAFVILWRLGVLGSERGAVVLESDWLYRRPGKALVGLLADGSRATWTAVSEVATSTASYVAGFARRHHNTKDGILGRTWATGVMAFWATAMLGLYIILFILNRGF